MGRPKKVVGKLNRPVSFRLSEAEHTAFLALVDQSGLNPSEFFRQRVLDGRSLTSETGSVSLARQQEILYLVNLTCNRIAALAELLEQQPEFTLKARQQQEWFQVLAHLHASLVRSIG
jgi:hypothetical protein